MQFSHNYSMIHTAKDEGRDEGRKEGEEERKKLHEALVQKDNIIANVIKNFIRQGLSPQQIAQTLQLDVEDVKKFI
jgi:predicted transposase YdaD